MPQLQVDMSRGGGEDIPKSLLEILVLAEIRPQQCFEELLERFMHGRETFPALAVPVLLEILDKHGLGAIGHVVG